MILRSLLFIKVTFLLITSCATSKPPEIQELFSIVEADEVTQTAALIETSEMAVIDSVIVKLNPMIIRGFDDPLTLPERIRVNTIKWGAREMAAIKFSSLPNDVVRWKLEGENGSVLDLFWKDGVANGSIYIEDMVLKVYGGVEQGVLRILELDEKLSVEGDDGVSNPLKTPDKVGPEIIKDVCDEDHGFVVPPGKGPRPSVMILWTRAARIWLEAQGRPIDIEIQRIMAMMSSAMQGRYTAVYPTLVHQQEISYVEGSQDMRNELRLLTNGFIPNVHALREAHRADLVSLIGHYPGSQGVCGIAWMNDNALDVDASAYGYSLNTVDVAGSSYCDDITPVHEVGHNMGMNHDRPNGGQSRLTYHFGHVGYAARKRTIMAYGNTCIQMGFMCPRVIKFSTPHVSYPKDGPMGVRADKTDAAHNFETLCRLAGAIERFRQ